MSLKPFKRKGKERNGKGGGNLEDRVCVAMVWRTEDIKQLVIKALSKQLV